MKKYIVFVSILPAFKRYIFLLENMIVYDLKIRVSKENRNQSETNVDILANVTVSRYSPRILVYLYIGSEASRLDNKFARYSSPTLTYYFFFLR